METIKKFKAIDGVEFTDSNECLKYENLIERVNCIMGSLPSLPENDGCSFANGGGFIQHEKELLKNAKIDILKICKEYIDHKWIQQTIDDENIHVSYIGRLLDDYGIRPLNKAWFRFMCIDGNLREWGQPYYAINPNDGKQICLNA